MKLNPLGPNNLLQWSWVRQALELRRDGHSYVDIAERLKGQTPKHMTPDRVANIILQACGQQARIDEETKDAVRWVELQRLDAMVRAFLPQAIKGSVPHAKVMMLFMERRAAYLGLDAPKKIEHRLTLDDVNAYLDKATDEQLEKLAAGEDLATVLGIEMN